VLLSGLGAGRLYDRCHAEHQRRPLSAVRKSAVA
jgi:hypothetical protein